MNIYIGTPDITDRVLFFGDRPYRIIQCMQTQDKTPYPCSEGLIHVPSDMDINTALDIINQFGGTAYVFPSHEGHNIAVYVPKGEFTGFLEFIETTPFKD
jgi:hypothetical protein